MKILLDTNILVYAYDPAEPGHQEQAIQILDRLYLSRMGRLSAQCLGEFFSAVTRPYRQMPPRLSPHEALRAVDRFAAHFQVYPLTPMTVIEAARGVCDHQLSYYDAQIWATARLNQVPVVFSEDFQHEGTLEGVRFINPFAPNFKAEAWL